MSAFCICFLLNLIIITTFVVLLITPRFLYCIFMDTHTWFECKVTFERVAEDQSIKKVTEPYLVDALSFTEAEARISKECSPFATGEFTVASVRRCKIAEMVFASDDDADKWYRCKVMYLSIDEEKQVEKRIVQTYMVQAFDFQNALSSLLKAMEGSLGDYEIAAITQTAILDVFPYEAPEA